MLLKLPIWCYAPIERMMKFPTYLSFVNKAYLHVAMSFFGNKSTQTLFDLSLSLAMQLCINGYKIFINLSCLYTSYLHSFIINNIMYGYTFHIHNHPIKYNCRDSCSPIFGDTIFIYNFLCMNDHALSMHGLSSH